MCYDKYCQYNKFWMSHKWRQNDAAVLYLEIPENVLDVVIAAEAKLL